MTRAFELKGHVVAFLRRLERPASASEIGSMGLRGRWPQTDVEAILEEMASYGFLSSETKTEPANPRARGSTRRVVRRYYRLAAAVTGKEVAP
jgi:hypothetical protein